MNCREFVDFLMAYLDGTLEASELEVFEAHMVDCPGCEAYLETYRETIRLGKACFCGGSDDLPEDVPEGLVQAILAAREAGETGKSGVPASSGIEAPGLLSRLAARLGRLAGRR
jgi:anti-sigma factor RsiW